MVKLWVVKIKGGWVKQCPVWKLGTFCRLLLPRNKVRPWKENRTGLF